METQSQPATHAPNMSTTASFSGAGLRVRHAVTHRRGGHVVRVASSEGYEEVRYGLGRGSVAFYPLKDGDASSTSTPSSSTPLLREDTEPTTRYTDGPLDAAAIWLFNLKLQQAVNDGVDDETRRKNGAGLPPGGFDRLVALADQTRLPRQRGRHVRYRIRPRMLQFVRVYRLMRV